MFGCMVNAQKQHFRDLDAQEEAAQSAAATEENRDESVTESAVAPAEERAAKGNEEA